jgi:hypothetical protein
MPDTVDALPVTGTAATDAGGTMLVLSQRLDGYDTFLTGRLVLTGAEPMIVRILTLDDITVLRILDEDPIPIEGVWTGVLHLPHGWRSPSLPADLAAAASDAQRDIRSLDGTELRYALAFLNEAGTPSIRQARINLIVQALPPSTTV